MKLWNNVFSFSLRLLWKCMDKAALYISWILRNTQKKDNRVNLNKMRPTQYHIFVFDETWKIVATFLELESIKCSKMFVELNIWLFLLSNFRKMLTTLVQLLCVLWVCNKTRLTWICLHKEKYSSECVREMLTKLCGSVSRPGVRQEGVK